MKKYLRNFPIELLSAWILAIFWISPLIYAFWAAFHPNEYAIHFDLLAPLTLSNFFEAWDQAPFARYFLNTFLIVSSILIAQFFICTLAAFGIFLLRQTFKTIPKELEEAARVEGCKLFGILLRVYVPLAKPTYLAYALVSVSYHWNNFLWPLVITNSVNTRPLTVGLAIFGAPESGVNWSVISAATLLSVSPLLLGFILFQKQFIQSFMYAGIK